MATLVSERRAREVAEAARERAWELPSFGRAKVPDEVIGGLKELGALGKVPEDYGGPGLSQVY